MCRGKRRGSRTEPSDTPTLQDIGQGIEKEPAKEAEKEQHMREEEDRENAVHWKAEQRNECFKRE